METLKNFRTTKNITEAVKDENVGVSSHVSKQSNFCLTTQPQWIEMQKQRKNIWQLNHRQRHIKIAFFEKFDNNYGAIFLANSWLLTHIPTVTLLAL